MSILSKPTWWNAFITQFNFPDDGQPTITSYELLQTLTDHVTGHFGDLLSPGFLATQNVAQDTDPDPEKLSIVVSSPTLATELIGRAGIDYLSGSSAGDIFYGGANKDFFVPRGGKDLIIGSTSLTSNERDTVTYETALSGIIVDHTDVPPPPPPLPYHAYYSASYDSWVAKINLNITNFVTGPGGDILNVYDLMSHTGYTGSDPVSAGYLRLVDMGPDMKIQFDPDGSAGKLGGSSAIVIRGLNVADFSIADNLVTSTPPPAPPPPTPPDISDYTLVSDDGHGSYDILYSVENIIGSNFNDIIHGRNDVANLLYGGAGDDALYGEGGNDTLNGAQGNDTIYGGTGNDFFLMSAGNDQYYGEAGQDTYKFGGDYLAATAPKTATIYDFEAGANGDRIDVSEILKSVHYNGANAIGDGYIGVTQGANGTEITFDKDGSAGPSQAEILATLNGVDSGAFTAANLTTSSPSIIFAPVLGQSNASSLRVLAGDSESGITRLEGGLRNQTDASKVYSVIRDENGVYLDTAIGGSIINGDQSTKPAVTWWYPAANKPGELAIRAADILITQISELRAQGSVTPVLIWGQGESDAFYIGSATTEAARAARQQIYIDATMSVFNYILDRIGHDVQIYIMETGHFNLAGAQASGVSQATTDKTVLGLTYIHAAQEQMALANANIHLAVNYDDLAMTADMPPSTPGYQASWAKDQWHLDYDSKEIVGDRLADFIAQDLGYDHIVDNPGQYPLHLLSDLTIHAGPGLLINGNANNNIITGTTGNDTIHGHEGTDAIVTGDGNDILDGGAGVDTLRGGAGADHFVFLQVSAYSGVDTIQDFNVLQGDVIDIFDLLNIYAANGGPLGSFVQITEDGAGNSILSVDHDGASTGYGFSQVVVLSGVTGLASVDALAASGNLRVPMVTNTPPPYVPVTAADDVFTGNEDAQISGNVLANNGNGADSNGGGASLTVLAANITTAHGGTVVLNANGSFTYTPATNYNGPDSFDYSVSDGTSSDTATATITLNAGNDAPTTKNDVFATVRDTQLNGNVLANNGNGADSDIDGDALNVQAANFATAHGFVSLAADGSFVYNPAANYVGGDSFTYTAIDGHGGSNTATVNITVTGTANVAPYARDDAFAINEDATLTGNVFANNGNGLDTDANGDALSVTAGTFATAHGSVTIAANGDFSYKAAANYNGTDNFAYSLSDGSLEGTANVTITVNAVNDNPVAQSDAFSAAYGQPISGNVLADNGSGADSDLDGDALAISSAVVTTSKGISVSIGANGAFTYNAPSGFSGTDSFVYTISDGYGGTSSATATLVIGAAPPPSPPIPVIPTINGNWWGETITGTANAEIIHALGGNDTVYGNDGDDTLYGEGGNDKLDGGIGADKMIGGIGNDTYTVDNSGDTVSENANEGIDTVRSTVTYTLTANVENLGLEGYSHINGTGNALHNEIQGSMGNNILVGGDGNDTIDGGRGDDVLYGDNGTDELEGGRGNDTVYGGDGNDMAEGGDGNDTIYGDTGNDALKGGNDNDTLYGNDGDDTLYGDGDNDALYGDAGNDTLNGGAGNDNLRGGAGFDLLYGNGGADKCIIDQDSFGSTADKIADFSSRQGDSLVLENILQGFDPLHDAITAFITKTQTGTSTTIFVDIDGAGTAHTAQAVAVLQSVTGFDIQTQYNTGHILIT